MFSTRQAAGCWWAAMWSCQGGGVMAGRGQGELRVLARVAAGGLEGGNLSDAPHPHAPPVTPRAQRTFMAPGIGAHEACTSPITW